MRLPAFLIALIFWSNTSSASGHKTALQQDTLGVVEIVFCLDLSGSTNGLINEARNHFWYTVNQLKAIEPSRQVRIAFVGFSRPSFGKSNAYVKVFADLSSDMDKVAAEMYRLRPSIEKGDQFVVHALETCVNDLHWSSNEQSVRLIFLVGNGIATANGTDYVKICEEAAEKNIVVNTIYIQNGSGKNTMRELPGWRRIANITHGVQTEITIGKRDTLKVYDQPASPQIKFQHQRLMQTMIWNGPDSAVCRKNVQSSDSGAFALSKDEYMNRLVYKSTFEFNNSLKQCEVIAGMSKEDELDSKGDPFIERLLAKMYEREKIRNEFHAVLPFDEIKNHHAMLKSGKVKDEGFFHRNVILAVMMKCNELPVSSEP